MNKYKTVKVYKARTTLEEEERKVPTWYYNFLKWLFASEEDFMQSAIQQEKTKAWDSAFQAATKQAHSYKEKVMQHKLYELGYEVVSTFPMAREYRDDMPTLDFVDPSSCFEVRKRNE